jgi:hypothetical protein
VYFIDKNTPYSEDYSAIELADKNKIIFTRTGNFLPVVRLSLTEGKV